MEPNGLLRYLNSDGKPPVTPAGQRPRQLFQFLLGASAPSFVRSRFQPLRRLEDLGSRGNHSQRDLAVRAIRCGLHRGPGCQPELPARVLESNLRVQYVGTPPRSVNRKLDVVLRYPGFLFVEDLGWLRPENCT